MREREINLMDLLMEFLSRWRTLLVWMLVGAIGLGAFAYFRQCRAVDDQKIQIDQARQKLELMETQGREDGDKENGTDRLQESLTDSQKAAVVYTLKMEENLEDRLAYEKISLLMKMDPDNVYKASVTFYLSSGSRERTSSIVAVYEDLIGGTGLMQYVAEQMGIEENNVSEVVSLMNRRNSAAVQEKDSFTVTVYYYDESGCRELVDTVIGFVRDRKEQLAQTIGDYEIFVLEPSVVALKDMSTSSYQNSFKADTLNVYRAIEDNKNAFAAAQWQYYDILVNGKITDLSIDKVKEMLQSDESMLDEEDSEQLTEKIKLQDIVDSGVTIKPEISVKYIVLGAVLAAFLYAFWIFMKYVFNARIRLTDDLQALYDIPQLGVIPAKSDRKRFLGNIDAMILRLRNRNKRIFSKEESVQLAQVAVKISALKENMTQLYFVGCDLKNEALEVCEIIKDGLSKDNIQVHILNNILYDAQALNEIKDAKGVVLVEKAGSSLYDEVLREKEILERQGVRVLGGVLVG